MNISRDFHAEKGEKNGSARKSEENAAWGAYSSENPGY